MCLTAVIADPLCRWQIPWKWYKTRAITKLLAAVFLPDAICSCVRSHFRLRAGDLASVVWALSFQPSVLPWRHAIPLFESPVKVRKVVKTTLSGDRKDRIVGCTQTVSGYI